MHSSLVAYNRDIQLMQGGSSGMKISELSQISQVSARSIRHYEQKACLKPTGLRMITVISTDLPSSGSK